MVNLSVSAIIQALKKLPDPNVGEKCYLKIPDSIRDNKFVELELEGKILELVEWVIINIRYEI